MYEKASHLPVELEDKAYWVLQTCNLDLGKARRERKFELSELNELRLDAYGSQQDYKTPTKLYHAKFILHRSFSEGDLVMLFSSN